MWTKKKEDKLKNEFSKKLKDEEASLLDEKLMLVLPRTYADVWVTNLGKSPEDYISMFEATITEQVKDDWSLEATVEFFRSDKRIIATDSDGKSMELVKGELISK